MNYKRDCMPWVISPDDFQRIPQALKRSYEETEQAVTHRLHENNVSHIPIEVKKEKQEKKKSK
jgi:hypothetical protein